MESGTTGEPSVNTTAINIFRSIITARLCYSVNIIKLPNIYIFLNGFFILKKCFWFHYIYALDLMLQ